MCHRYFRRGLTLTGHLKHCGTSCYHLKFVCRLKKIPSPNIFHPIGIFSSFVRCRPRPRHAENAARPKGENREEHAAWQEAYKRRANGSLHSEQTNRMKGEVGIHPNPRASRFFALNNNPFRVFFLPTPCSAQPGLNTLKP